MCNVSNLYVCLTVTQEGVQTWAVLKYYSLRYAGKLPERLLCSLLFLKSCVTYLHSLCGLDCFPKVDHMDRGANHVGLLGRPGRVAASSCTNRNVHDGHGGHVQHCVGNNVEYFKVH